MKLSAKTILLVVAVASSATTVVMAGEGGGCSDYTKHNKCNLSPGCKWVTPGARCESDGSQQPQPDEAVELGETEFNVVLQVNENSCAGLDTATKCHLFASQCEWKGECLEKQDDVDNSSELTLEEEDDCMQIDAKSVCDVIGVCQWAPPKGCIGVSSDSTHVPPGQAKKVVEETPADEEDDEEDAVEDEADDKEDAVEDEQDEEEESKCHSFNKHNACNNEPGCNWVTPGSKCVPDNNGVGNDKSGGCAKLKKEHSCTVVPSCVWADEACMDETSRRRNKFLRG